MKNILAILLILITGTASAITMDFPNTESVPEGWQHWYGTTAMYDGEPEGSPDGIASITIPGLTNVNEITSLWCTPSWTVTGETINFTNAYNCDVDSIRYNEAVSSSSSSSSSSSGGGSSSSSSSSGGASSSSSSSGGQDPILANIPLSPTWQQYFPAVDSALPENAQAYSGGCYENGVLKVTGGGHGNFYNDAIATLTFSNFSTVGWITPQTVAQFIGLEETDPAVSDYMAANYLGNSLFQKGQLISKVSFHTFDYIVCLNDNVYVFGGTNSYDSPNQGPVPWPNRTDNISVYEAGNWRYITSIPAQNDVGLTAATVVNSTTIEYIDGNWNIRSFDTVTEQTTLVRESIGSFNSEGWMEHCNGVTYWGGGYDITTFSDGTTTNPLPFNDARFGAITCANNALYGYENGTMWEYDGNVWNVVATGAPVLAEPNRAYGRFGYDTDHGLFYYIEYINGSWQNWFVRIN